MEFPGESRLASLDKCREEIMMTLRWLHARFRWIWMDLALVRNFPYLYYSLNNKVSLINTTRVEHSLFVINIQTISSVYLIVIPKRHQWFYLILEYAKLAVSDEARTYRTV